MLNGLLERFAGQELVLGWNDEERKRIQISIDNLTSCIYRRLSRQDHGPETPSCRGNTTRIPTLT